VNPLVSLEHVLTFFRGIDGLQAALILALIPLLEASAFVGILLPGESALMLGGVLVALGHVSFATMAVAGSVGAVIGDSIGYGVGRRWGQRIMSSRAASWVGEHRWQQARLHMRRRGFWAVVLGRFPPGVRSLVPMVAGSARMSYGRFLTANAFGGVVWAISSIALGRIAGEAWQQAHGIAMIVTLGLAIIVAMALRLRRRHARSGIPPS
jgi:membrane-associated protein